MEKHLFKIKTLPSEFKILLSTAAFCFTLGSGMFIGAMSILGITDLEYNNVLIYDAQERIDILEDELIRLKIIDIAYADSSYIFTPNK